MKAKVKVYILTRDEFNFAVDVYGSLDEAKQALAKIIRDDQTWNDDAADVAQMVEDATDDDTLYYEGCDTYYKIWAQEITAEVEPV